MDFFYPYLLNSSNQPIGIFDSGIGGLTVAYAIKELLPNESLIYFGDTAHLPYGDKSAESIKNYSKAIAQFLEEKGCKMVVIACNTASSYAYAAVKAAVPRHIPVINVIDPIVDYLEKNHANEKVGVIGTKGTINSRVFPRKLKKKNKDIEVATLATSLLAPMIEEGYFNNNISRTIIFDYLSKKNLKGIKAIALACTHYPLIRKTVDEYYKGKVDIVDSAQVVALKVKETLVKSNLLSDNKKPKYQFYVSDFTEAFDQSTRIFFHEKISLKQVKIWQD